MANSHIIPGMKILPACAPLALLLALLSSGCSNSPRDQERVRENTANATAAIASSAKSAVLGIKDGLTRNAAEKGVNINTASRLELESSPASHGYGRRNHRESPLHQPHRTPQKEDPPKDVYDRISGRLTLNTK